MPLRSPIRTWRVVVVEELRAERADRDQPVGAGFVERDEQAEAGDAGDPADEDLADARRQEGGDVAVDGVALGRRRAPLGRRDVLADGGEAALSASARPSSPSP